MVQAQEAMELRKNLRTKKFFIQVLFLLFTCKINVLISLIADEWKHETNLYCKGVIGAGSPEGMAEKRPPNG